MKNIFLFLLLSIVTLLSVTETYAQDDFLTIHQECRDGCMQELDREYRLFQLNLQLHEQNPDDLFQQYLASFYRLNYQLRSRDCVCDCLEERVEGYSCGGLTICETILQRTIISNLGPFLGNQVYYDSLVRLIKNLLNAQGCSLEC